MHASTKRGHAAARESQGRVYTKKTLRLATACYAPCMPPRSSKLRQRATPSPSPPRRGPRARAAEPRGAMRAAQRPRRQHGSRVRDVAAQAARLNGGIVAAATHPRFPVYTVAPKPLNPASPRDIAFAARVASTIPPPVAQQVRATIAAASAPSAWDTMMAPVSGAWNAAANFYTSKGADNSTSINWGRVGGTLGVAAVGALATRYLTRKSTPAAVRSAIARHPDDALKALRAEGVPTRTARYIVREATPRRSPASASASASASRRRPSSRRRHRGMSGETPRGASPGRGSPGRGSKSRRTKSRRARRSRSR